MRERPSEDALDRTFALPVWQGLAHFLKKWTAEWVGCSRHTQDGMQVSLILTRAVGSKDPDLGIQLAIWPLPRSRIIIPNAAAEF